MIKLVELLVRKEGTTHEAFADYWLDEHSPVAAELPGVEKYVTALPTDPERSEYDGVLELYFADVDALRAAFDSGWAPRRWQTPKRFSRSVPDPG